MVVNRLNTWHVLVIIVGVRLLTCTLLLHSGQLFGAVAGSLLTALLLLSLSALVELGLDAGRLILQASKGFLGHTDDAHHAGSQTIDVVAKIRGQTVERTVIYTFLDTLADTIGSVVNQILQKISHNNYSFISLFFLLLLERTFQGECHLLSILIDSLQRDIQLDALLLGTSYDSAFDIGLNRIVHGSRAILILVGYVLDLHAGFGKGRPVGHLERTVGTCCLDALLTVGCRHVVGVVGLVFTLNGKGTHRLAACHLELIGAVRVDGQRDS